MNAIMDLTARATSFVTAIQTTLLRGAILRKEEDKRISILNIDPKSFREIFTVYTTAEEDTESAEFKKSEEDSFCVKSIELVWISKQTSPDINIANISRNYAIDLCDKLVSWIDRNSANGIKQLRDTEGYYPTPFKWREIISHILHADADERVALADALQYLPIQIVLALGGGALTSYRQRILQTWRIGDAQQAVLLNSQERSWLSEFTTSVKAQPAPETLLMDDNKLLETLLQKAVPISFEQVFTTELQEIVRNRKRRISEECVAGADKTFLAGPISTADSSDPFEKAQQMNGLVALAFSGGGIRSATFNLGILQGLARENILNKFDYLSTVSGGGYIGSWLAAWMKRDGSVVKVSNRLCPDKSPDPAGEELRPVKWLRMFSNYFAPNASIMSADAWTVGVTWLRNTLLNQVIIFLALLSVLFFGNLLFIAWGHIIDQRVNYARSHVIVYSVIALIPLSFLAGLGMHAYHSNEIRWLKIKKEDTKRISRTILGIGFVGAYLISAWLCSNWNYNGDQPASFGAKFKLLIPAAVVNSVALMIVALLGKYADCIREMLSPVYPRWREWLTWLLLLATAAATALVSLLCITGAWVLLQHIHFSTGIFADYNYEVRFILGFPIVLEVFSITLVARMAFLGRYFPDERREWWGRMGAYIHRTSFLWLLIAASALLGQHFIAWVFHKSVLAGAVAGGGWTALILSTVKAAFSNKTSGSKDTGKTISIFANVLALVGPYLFALGLLIFLPGLIKPIYGMVYHWLSPDAVQPEGLKEQYVLLIVACCFIAALLLSKQVGVNEFSMHHFYRNRLVRAYLGATRRSTDRQKTSNPFTGFDMRDDEKLAKMKNEFGYYGPYPILNVALNASEVTDLDRQDRKAESFIFSPFFCGFDFSMLKSNADSKTKSYDYAYRETKDYAGKDGGPGIGTAMAISGAAVNPNQGYHSSPATAFLLTAFNVQMGWWMGNPRKYTWQSSEPSFGLGYIFNNLVGKTNTRSNYVALSDGGHFDNMGLYELIRRKCSYIVLCDAEQDDQFTCEGFANAVRRCRIDFGADITIDIDPIVNREKNRFSKCHSAIGDIIYPGNHKPGKLLYIKSSILEKGMPVDIFEYAKKNATFPHQSTADQFFDEEQFESYRNLGLWIAHETFKGDILQGFILACTKDSQEPANETAVSR